jgi:hypothetical protein
MPPNPHDLPTTDADAFARWVQIARPKPISAADRTRVLRGLPEAGEVIELSASAWQKLAALTPLLRATDRESVYVVKAVEVPQAMVGLHARTVVLVSEPALNLLSADELRALIAHEIGHEYLWPEYERAAARADPARLKDLELLCDAIAIVTLEGLGLNPHRLMTGVEKMSRFNRDRFGIALNEKDYPTLAERRAYAQTIVQWTVRAR